MKDGVFSSLGRSVLASEISTPEFGGFHPVFSKRDPRGGKALVALDVVDSSSVAHGAPFFLWTSLGEQRLQHVHGGVSLDKNHDSERAWESSAPTAATLFCRGELNPAVRHLDTVRHSHLCGARTSRVIRSWAPNLDDPCDSGGWHGRSGPKPSLRTGRPLVAGLSFDGVSARIHWHMGCQEASGLRA